MAEIGKWLWNAAKRVLVEVLPPFPLLENQEKYYTLLQQKGLGEESKVYLQFLLKVLGVTSDLLFLVKAPRATVDGRSEEAINSLLAANTEKLNLTLAKVLRCWASASLAKVETYTAQKTATVILDFSDRISEFSLGDKASNIEIAITGYEIVLTVFTQQDFPQKWAMTQNNLADAYLKRRLGKPGDNIEQAIACLQNCLKFYTFEAYPYDWAKAQSFIAAAYSQKSEGEKAQNLEQAIACYKEAEEVFTLNNYPFDWAAMQLSFAEVYRNRILGDKALNLEQAITYFQNALKVFTYDTAPKQWATTQSVLSITYSRRILGNETQNLEMAIACCQEALKVLTYDAYRKEWARAQLNLADAYLRREQEKPAENLEVVIASCRKVRKVYTSLGANPEDWSDTYNSLAIAYSQRIRRKPAKNLEMAIACCHKALKVYTHDANPQRWAYTQTILANAYSLRIKGKPAENQEMAIACYKEALKVRTCDAFPQDYAQTLSRLGMIYQKANQLTLAYDNFQSAIATVESLRSEIVSGEESKRKLAEYFNQVYSCMVKVCLELGYITAAIEYVERSKTRNLVEQILERDYKTIFSEDDVTQLQRYNDEIAQGQSQIQNGTAENREDLAKKLQELRKKRNELQKKYLRVGTDFTFDDSFKDSVDEHTAIIEWYILNDKILAFIVTKQAEVNVWQSQPEDREALYDWVNQYLQNYYGQKGQWRNNLGEELKQLASILHIDEILTQIPKHCDKLILIPHQFLHLFPLHAIPVSHNSENSSCLLDLFAGGVSYAPSCQLLQQVQERKRPDFQSLFAIQNPTEDLNYTDLEVQVIQSYFNTSNVLKKTAATLTAINNTDLNTYHCAHFSCHGYFNFINPSQSALILANPPIADILPQPNTERYLNLRLGEIHDLDKCLTLDKIFTLKLEKCRLVTLSACETGLIDLKNTSDEYIGLPSGFLLAGSQAVVSSLWTVGDLSTAFLMMKFYETLQTINSVSIALNQAQQWLRNLTIEEFEIVLEQYKPQIETTLEQMRPGQSLLFQEYLKRIRQGQSLPFANPYHWAAFTAIGV